jgi:D-threo-aldose 1-dehydrogenase
MSIHFRSLGRSALKVTELGFGGAPLGYVRLSADTIADMVATAWGGGIRYFDTAPLYGGGESERRLGGELVKQQRDAFVLSTKVGRVLVPAAEAGQPLHVEYDYTYDGARRSFDASLDRLGLDRVDILLCHDIDVWTHGAETQPGIYKTAVEGVIKALAWYREQGVIGAFGLGVNEWSVCARLLDDVAVDCFLLAGRFTLLEQEPLDEFLPKCLRHQASVIIGGPYNSGLLATSDRQRATYDYKPVPDALWDKAQAIRAVCNDHGVDIRAAALQYPLQHRAVASVIPGPRSLLEVEENLALFNTALPDALWDDLDARNLSRRLR